MSVLMSLHSLLLFCFAFLLSLILLTFFVLFCMRLSEARAVKSREKGNVHIVGRGLHKKSDAL